jgi:cytidylate kinase
MPIITISRGSYFYGKSIAEKLAQRLNYACVSRDEIIDKLDEFHLPEIKLVRELKDAYSVLDRFPHGKKRFISAIRSAILNRFLSSNVVYHGLVGHYFVSNISHVLKVRIISDIESRVAGEMARENISEEKARYILKKDDEERRKWAMFLYGVDLADPEAYNLVIRIGHLSEDDAVDIIVGTVGLSSFQETAESKAALADIALTSTVIRKLFDFPYADVVSRDGQVKITLKAPEEQQSLIRDRVAQILSSVDEINEHMIHFDSYF